MERLNGFEPSTSTLARSGETQAKSLEEHDLGDPQSKVCPEVCPPIGADTVSSLGPPTDLEVQGLISLLTRLASSMDANQRQATLARLQQVFGARHSEHNGPTSQERPPLD